MTQYLARRLLSGIPVLIAISILIFAGVRAVPGDVCTVVLQNPEVTEAECARLYARLGLDKPAIRVEVPSGFYDYEAKYVADDTRYLIPCGVSKAKEQQVQALSLRAFQALGCRGWGRVDLMLDKRGRPFLLEVNTSPGMTDHSLVPMAARAVGMSYEDLCVKVLEMARVG
jgi:D-alanine--D-alanine ligase